MNRRLFIGAAGAMLLAGCGDGDDPTTPAPTPDETTPGVTPTTTRGNPRPTTTTRSLEPTATRTTGAPVIPLLVDIRVGRHTGYDRITFEFEGPLPKYETKFVKQAIEDGSGNVVTVPGNKLLEVRFEPCNAHREDGSMTGGRKETLNFESITAWRVTGDFEAVVHVVVGVVDDNKVKVRTLSNPNRVYIDVPHTDEVGA